MVQIDADCFLAITTLPELAAYFDIPLRQLTFFAFSESNFYSTFLIPKKGSIKNRKISSPCSNLKLIQRILADTLSQVYKAPDTVHGFLEGRSTATNALQHVRKRSVVKVDLEDFFPSISAKRIRGLFINEPFSFPKEVADALTNLTCHDGSLPQGAPSSPILSNMICYRMDRALMQFARQCKLKYTRYADDLTFSSTTKHAIASVVIYSENDTVTVSKHVCGIIKANGFKINDKKTGLFNRNTRQVVTGIVVNKKCNFRRSDFRYLRGLFHYWNSTDVESAARRYVQFEYGRHYYSRFFSKDDNFSEAAFLSHIHGLLSYYSMIAQANNRHSRPLQALWTSFHDVSGLPVPEMIPERSVFQTDSGCKYRVPGSFDWNEYGVRGTAFAVKGGFLVSARHCAKYQSESCIHAIYDENSVFEVGNTRIAYDQLSDNFFFDWAICTVPEELDTVPGLTLDFGYYVQEGEKVIAYGFADGKHQLRRIETQVVDILDNEVVVDRAFIEGMSGGPVLNTRGDAIGVITKGSSDGTYDRDGRFVLLNSIPKLVSLQHA